MPPRKRKTTIDTNVCVNNNVSEEQAQKVQEKQKTSKRQTVKDKQQLSEKNSTNFGDEKDNGVSDKTNNGSKGQKNGKNKNKANKGCDVNDDVLEKKKGIVKENRRKTTSASVNKEKVEENRRKMTRASVNKEVKSEEKLQRKRKACTENKVGRPEGFDDVDGDVDVKNFEDSKIMKLDPWPVRDSWKMHLETKATSDNKKTRTIQDNKHDKTVENSERKRQKLKIENAGGKGRKRTICQKSKQNERNPTAERNEEDEFDLNSSPMVKKKKIDSEIRSRKSVGGNQNKGKKTASDSKTKSQKTKTNKKEVGNKSVGEINHVEIMSDDSSDEEHKEKKTKPDCTQKSDVKTEPVKASVKHVNMGDVTSVLLMMEGKDKPSDDVKPSTSGIHMHGDEEVEDFMEASSDEEESDWEEVEALPGHESPKKSQVPSGPIEITIDAPQIMKKRKKKEFDIKAFFKRQLNRFQKELRESMHKVHFMCLLSRGMYLNKLCQDPVLSAQALSVLPRQFSSVSMKTFNINLLGRIVIWFRDTFQIQTTSDMEAMPMAKRLEESFKIPAVYHYLERALVLVILLRTLGLMTRFVMSLQPVSLKPSRSKGTSTKPSKEDSKGSKGSLRNKLTKSPSTSNKTEKTSKGKTVTSVKKRATQDNTNRKDTSESKYFKTKNEKLRLRGSKVKPKSYKDDDNEIVSGDEYVPSSENEDDYQKEKDRKGGKQSNSKSTGKTKKQKTENTNSSSDDDFEEDSFSPRSPVSLLRKSSDKPKNRKIVSSDSESDGPKGCDTWTEVYLESEEKWICIDSVICMVVHNPYIIESKATAPVHYVFCFDNDGYIKDITPRYASKWLTDTRKVRVAEDWLEETIEPYKSPDVDNHLKEEDDIKASLVSKPLPSSIGEFKNHPLYALKRHLLKFEAIYPNTAVPVGYLKNSEPVYSRECVYTLHSRENWLKEGRAVRVKEEPYKMVKSRARWGRKKDNPDELDLEIFGFWQTEVYIPPPAVNGKVPRNGYGNIELFMPSMLPAGTVHLQLPGLNKVARKLDIDCVAAMTGWDTHCGYSHPVLDGFVVCEEFKDVLIAAWDEDQEIQKQRESEKREKRVTQNWQLLTKGLLIKERLKRKYLLQPNLHEKDQEKTETKTGEKSDDLKHSWPMNKAGSQSLSTAKHFKTETL